MLDAILSPEWEYRYFSFNSKWADGASLGSMRNGSGDEYFVYFNEAGVIIKGFDHESEMSPFTNDQLKIWPGVLDTVPIEFNEFLTDPSMPPEYTTFCIWRLDLDAVWRIGTIDYPQSDTEADGSKELLFALDGQTETYVDFASGYYGTEIDSGTVELMYGFEPLTSGMVKSLNAEIEIEDLSEDIDEIGYPRAL